MLVPASDLPPSLFSILPQVMCCGSTPNYIACSTICFFGRRAQVSCIPRFVLSSWLPPLCGFHMCTAASQLYSLYINKDTAATNYLVQSLTHMSNLHIVCAAIAPSVAMFYSWKVSRSLRPFFFMLSTYGSDLTTAEAIAPPSK